MHTFTLKYLSQLFNPNKITKFVLFLKGFINQSLPNNYYFQSASSHREFNNNSFTSNNTYTFQQGFSGNSRNRYPNGYLPTKRRWQYTNPPITEKSSEKPAKLCKNVAQSSVSLQTNTRTTPCSQTLKVCSYNLLAPDLLDSNANLYRHIDRQYLSWNYRKNKLIYQLTSFSADVNRFLDSPLCYALR